MNLIPMGRAGNGVLPAKWLWGKHFKLKTNGKKTRARYILNVKLIACVIAGLATGLLAAWPGAAQGEETSVAEAVTNAPPALAPGVADILKLSQAKVGDSVIVAYMNNGRTIYNLDADQIVYLREQGVSDHVISAMLSQKQRYLEAAAQTPQAQQSTSAPALAESAYAEPEPVQTPASSVYVIPYEPAWPDYGYYYDWYPGPYFYGGFGFSHFRSYRFGHSFGSFRASRGFGGGRSFGSHSSFHGSTFHGSFHGSFHGRR